MPKYTYERCAKDRRTYEQCAKDRRVRHDKEGCHPELDGCCHTDLRYVSGSTMLWMPDQVRHDNLAWPEGAL